MSDRSWTAALNLWPPLPQDRQQRQQPPTDEERAITRAVFLARVALNSGGSCIGFFGEKASRSLSNLESLLRPGKLNDPDIGIEMKNIGTVSDANKPPYARLPNTATVNTDGPFYNTFYTSRQGLPLRPNIGEFKAGSIEAQVLQILHELAHLVYGTDAKPLIPYDGDNKNQSTANTDRVQDACKQQIRTAVTRAGNVL